MRLARSNYMMMVLMGGFKCALWLNFGCCQMTCLRSESFKDEYVNGVMMLFNFVS